MLSLETARIELISHGAVMFSISTLPYFPQNTENGDTEETNNATEIVYQKGKELMGGAQKAERSKSEI